MKIANKERKRVVGGFSFGDSIIRTNGDTEKYIGYILSRINSELIKGEEELRYVKNKKYIQFFIGDKKLLWLKASQIEQYRSEAVTMLERILLSNLECSGYSFDTENKYYKQVWGLRQ
jgi:hypothetical protein